MSEMYELLQISLDLDLISGLLLFERYAEVSSNPIPKELLEKAKELKRKSNFVPSKFFYL